MKKQNTCVILNPASAGGRTAKRQQKIVAALRQNIGHDFSFFPTKRPKEAGEIARSAILRGSELIIAVGGDGTIQEVVNGFFVNGHLTDFKCQLGFISSGTGQGFSQSLGLPLLLEDQINMIATGRRRKVDVGRVTYMNERGQRESRYFINECQLGIGGEVVQRVQQNHKLLGGTLAFGLETVKTVFRYRNQLLRIKLDGGKEISEKFTGVVIANGAYTGGGMMLAPRADVADGLLDIILMRNLSIRRRLETFSMIYSGAYIDLPYISYQKSRSLTIASNETILVEADGELLGTTPCTIEILPSILSVCA